MRPVIELLPLGTPEDQLGSIDMTHRRTDSGYLAALRALSEIVSMSRGGWLGIEFVGRR